MVDRWSEQLQELLRRTSAHSQPSRIALAVAVGVLAGLVPKANLLGMVLVGATLLLPIHNLLALVVCASVSLCAGGLDGLTHPLGRLLLLSPSLGPVWRTLESSYLLPWLHLNNTVVLGAWVLGLLQLGPCYMLALRYLERFDWSERNEEALQRQLAAKPAQPAPSPRLKPRPQLVVAASENFSATLLDGPHFLRKVTTARQSSAAGAAPTEADVAQEANATHEANVPLVPVGSGAAENLLERSWHMGRRGSLQTLSAVSLAPADEDARSTSLRISGPPASRSKAELLSDGYSRVPDFRQGNSAPDSLQVAASAAEMIQWVEEALEDCLAIDRPDAVMRGTWAGSDEDPRSGLDASADGELLAAAESLAEVQSPVDAEPPVDGELLADGEGLAAIDALEAVQGLVEGARMLDEPEQWLMETTIEVVRWAEPAHGERGRRDSDLTPRDVSQRDCQSLESELSLETMQTAALISREITRPSEARAVTSEPTPSRNRDAQTSSEARSEAGGTPARGESLGYLLQYLKETRDGHPQ
jgi:uncharacterized protein (TIGR03546 family)